MTTPHLPFRRLLPAIALVALLALMGAACGDDDAADDDASSETDDPTTDDESSDDESSDEDDGESDDDGSDGESDDDGRDDVAAGDCGVTLEEAQALAPADVTVEAGDPEDDEPGQCQYRWAGQVGSLGDPSRASIFRVESAEEAEAFTTGLADGLYGPMTELDEPGDQAFVSEDDGSEFVQFIVIDGDVVVNIQLRYFQDRDDAVATAEGLARAAL